MYLTKTQKPSKTICFWQKPITHGENSKNPGFFTTLVLSLTTAFQAQKAFTISDRSECKRGIGRALKVNPNKQTKHSSGW